MLYCLFRVIVLACWYPVAHSQISLPFKDKLVSGVKFDGQPVQLLMDTGSNGASLVYKDWYEKTYGKDACKNFQGGCYSCPGECDPYSKEKVVMEFADDSRIITVSQEGVVEVGGKKLKMQFHLIIGFSPSPQIPDGKPENYLGLAFPTKASPDAIVNQLYKNKIIKKYAVSVCSTGDMMSFDGTLIFGEWEGLCAIKPSVTTIPMVRPRRSDIFDSGISSYGLVSSTGKRFEGPVRGSAEYDTGTLSIFLPKNIFETVLNKLTDFAGPGTSVRSDEDNVWYITDKGYDSLPTLTFTVGKQGSPLVLRIPPRKYAPECDDGWCWLTLVYHDEPDVLFGRSFFTTYFSSYDLKDLTVTIAEYASR